MGILVLPRRAVASERGPCGRDRSVIVATRIIASDDADNKRERAIQRPSRWPSKTFIVWCTSCTASPATVCAHCLQKQTRWGPATATRRGAATTIETNSKTRLKSGEEELDLTHVSKTQLLKLRLCSAIAENAPPRMPSPLPCAVPAPIKCHAQHRMYILMPQCVTGTQKGPRILKR